MSFLPSVCPYERKILSVPQAGTKRCSVVAPLRGTECQREAQKGKGKGGKRKREEERGRESKRKGGRGRERKREKLRR